MNLLKGGTSYNTSYTQWHLIQLLTRTIKYWCMVVISNWNKNKKIMPREDIYKDLTHKLPWTGSKTALSLHHIPWYCIMCVAMLSSSWASRSLSSSRQLMISSRCSTTFTSRAIKSSSWAVSWSVFSAGVFNIRQRIWYSSSTYSSSRRFSRLLELKINTS